MKLVIICMMFLIFSALGMGQRELREIKEAEWSFINAARSSGTKNAYLSFLSDNSVVFQPGAANGLAVWQKAENSLDILERTPIFADAASNGGFGYTTGHWKSQEPGKPDTAKYGQYVTVWQRSKSGTFKIALDIITNHEEFPAELLEKLGSSDKPSKESNKKGWSAADATMNFYRLGNNQNQLGGAYEKYSSEKVRLLIDGDAPVFGKKDAVYKMSRYRSMEFPEKIAMLEAADMAYVWNPCEFADSAEGKEKGNCLHIWKLKDKKWWIVMGVFASVREPSSAPSKLQDRTPVRKTQ